MSRLFAGGQAACGQTRNTSIWLWVDSTGNGVPDPSISGSSAPHLGIALDGTPPPAPDGIVVEGADRSLKVSWNGVSANDPDLGGTLVFCMGEDGQPVFSSSYYNDQYMTGTMTCGASAPVPSTADPVVSAAGNTTAVEVDAPQPFQEFDPRYLCSDRLSPAVTSLRLRLPQNGVPTTIGLAAVDLSGNISPIRKAFVQSTIAGVDPIPDKGATKLGDSGCDCHLAGAGRDATPWIGLLLLALAGRLRRRGT